MSKYYLFTWPGYESGGVIDDCLGSFKTIEAAKACDGLDEIGAILEVRNGGLWIVAEYSGYPPNWEVAERRLELEAQQGGLEKTMNIDEMPAGRELDALVAQAMGWTQINKSSGKLMGVPPNTMNRTTQVKIPLFSTGGISTAWPVWEWLPRKLHGSDVFALEVSLSDCLAWRYDTDPERVYIVTAKWHGETQYSGGGNTPELAICRAALKAVME